MLDNRIGSVEVLSPDPSTPRLSATRLNLVLMSLYHWLRRCHVRLELVERRGLDKVPPS